MAPPQLRELSLPRRMALRVRLAIALELRDEGLPDGDEAGYETQRALKEKLFAAARGFFVNHKDASTARAMIENSRRCLDDLGDIANSTIMRRFSRIADALDRFSCEHCSGDPTALQRCLAEIHEVFESLDSHVLRQYRKAGAGFPEPRVWLELGHHHEDEISDILDATSLSGASRIADDTETSVSIVRLGVRDHGLDWRSLCQLPYVLMHELICHAYQGIAATGRTPVDASCSWSEGWMDAFAAVQIEEWLLGQLRKPDWVEVNSVAIKRATGGLHERRYQSQSSLRPYILAQRVSARDGFASLVQAYRGADTREDRANARAARFSMRLNLEPLTQDDRARLVMRLVSGLESFFSLRRTELLAACTRYAEDGDLAKFRASLDAIES